MKKTWQIVTQSLAYDGYFKIEKYRLKHTQYEGGWGPEIDREMMLRGNVGAVLPYDPQTSQVLLIEQFRAGAMHVHDEPWLLELIAGVIEPGETAEQMLHREAQEEAGIALRDLRLISHYLVSPGCSSEHMSLYFAHADLSAAGGVHGLPEEGENILVKLMSVDDALVLLERGQINNAMTLIGLQWLALHRNNL